MQLPPELQAQVPLPQEPVQQSLFDEQAAPPGRQSQRPLLHTPAPRQQSESTVQLPPPPGRASPQHLPLKLQLFSQQSVSKLQAEPLFAQQ